jgi:ABC-2 type transport system ATP-binding protein
LIEIENLVKRYGRVNALNGIDLSINSGELFAYLGPNGAGKTTTIRILTGLTRLTAGKVRLNGHDIENDPLSAKKQFGLVPQQTNLDSELTVFENLFIHGRLHHMIPGVIRERIGSLLDYIELTDKRDTPAKELSGGMKRRVMIARALLHHPAILFLDEPTVGLDPAIRRRIWALIKKIQQDGITILLTTHYIEEAEFLAERVGFIDQGKIVALDTPGALMDGIGRWALDQFEAEPMETLYFNSREAARARAADREIGFTLRRVNLEDAFLALTGKKVK